MTKLDELTERKLKALEKKLEKIYSRANAELEEKANAFFSQFLPLQEKYDELLKSKQITQQEYDDALRKDILTASQYQELQSQLAYDYTKINEEALSILAYDYTKINEEALSIVNGELPSIYVLNYNETAKEIGSAVDGYTFQLVNEQTVRNLATQNKSYLPTKKLDIPKDLRWNQKRINAELLQGILQGESVDRIAKRLRNVTSMTLAESKRNARTMVTSAQNKARIDEYEKAEADGVVLKKQWLAAIDSRTRETHRKLDGQERDVDEPFLVEDDDGILQQIRYPGDPLSAPAMIYNCRCTLVTRVVGFRKKV